MRSLLIVLISLSCAACSVPVMREISPASLGDLDRLEAKVTEIPTRQNRAFTEAVAGGKEVGEAVAAAFQAGEEEAQKPSSPEGNDFPNLLNLLLEILGFGAAGTVGATFASRLRRGVTLVTGKPKDPDPKVNSKARAKKG